MVAARGWLAAHLLVLCAGSGCASLARHDHRDLGTTVALQRQADWARRAAAGAAPVPTRLLVEAVAVPSLDGGPPPEALERLLRTRLVQLIDRWGLFREVVCRDVPRTGGPRRSSPRWGPSREVVHQGDGAPPSPEGDAWLEVEVRDLCIEWLGWHPGPRRVVLHCLAGYPGAWAHDGRYRLRGEMVLRLRRASAGPPVAMLASGPLALEDTLSFHERTSGPMRYLLINLWPAPWIPDDRAQVAASLLTTAAGPALSALFFHAARDVGGLRPTVEWAVVGGGVLGGERPLEGANLPPELPMDLTFRRLGPGATAEGLGEQLSVEGHVRGEDDYLVGVELDGRRLYPAEGTDGGSPRERVRELRRRALVLHPVAVDLGREVHLVWETARAGRTALVGRIHMEARGKP